MRIQVLGPMRVWRGGDALDLGPPARRAVLGLLALAGGRPVPRTELFAGIWYGRPPASAANVIQTHIKHLRRVLEPDRQPRARGNVVHTIGDGYALYLPDSTMDIFGFRRQVSQAAESQRLGRLDVAAAALDEALALWHGPPLADIPVLAAHPKVVALAEERLAALVRYGEVMLALGRAADGLPALEEAAAAQPLNESGLALLIRAYHAAGRRAHAFATYQQARRRLVDDLGVDPGPELLGAHAELLREDIPPPGDAGPAGRPTPAQLPADVPAFAGRAVELLRLDQLAEALWRPERHPAPAIGIVSGPAGVGKTSLALHWAHGAAHRFPDGQLYLDLRGFSPDGTAMDAAEAMRRFLDALDVPAARIPSGVDAQAALYRSELAGRRVLVVLDNARDTAQVRPLLPGGPGCLVLVTSRVQLAGLVAAVDASPIPLDPLSPDEARELLLRRIGADRTAAEPAAVAEILARCAGLPLALAIVAARVVTRPNLPLGALAEELGGTHDRLGGLRTGDPDTDLAEVFSWSYRALTADAADLFRLLGLHPGPDISTAAAASLAAWSLPRTRATLAELVGANLVAEHIASTPARHDGRYVLHDLLRAYAADLGERADPAPYRREAHRRILAHYLHSGHAADRVLNPSRVPIALAAPPPGVTRQTPTDYQGALAWFTAEHRVLLAAVPAAVAAGWDNDTWQLAWTLGTFLDRCGHWYDLLGTQLAAVAAARAVADPSAEAAAHRLLARAHTRLGALGDAHTHLRRALRIYRRAGDRTGQGDTHLNLSLMWERQGAPANALDHAQAALKLFQADDNRWGEARARNATGWYLALLDDHPRALAYCEEALVQLEELGDRSGQASTWDSLGYSHHHLGHVDQAVACYRRARDLYRGLGDRHLEALVLIHLGDAHRTAEDSSAAGRCWQQALTILTEVDRPAAARTRARLAALPLAASLVVEAGG
jgi:DNA-binding SARP family transcriptional activator